MRARPACAPFHAHFYAAFVRDLDGNKLVCRLRTAGIALHYFTAVVSVSRLPAAAGGRKPDAPAFFAIVE